MSRIIGMTLASIALVALLAACSGAATGPGVATLDDPSASGSPGAAPSASAPLTPQDAALAYARCMRENGVDMPDPKVTTSADGEVMIDQRGGSEVSKDEMAKADEACRHFMTAAGPSGPGRQMDPESMDKLLAFARCMREHGVDMPDPTADGGIVFQQDTSGGANGSAGAGKLSPDDPDFQEAQTACASFLPGKVGEPRVNRSDGAADPGGGPGSVTKGGGTVTPLQ